MDGPANALPTDMDWFKLGEDVGDTDYMHGLIDDFAVYGGVLASNDIVNLFNGASPTSLPTNDVLLAYWPFDDAPAIATGSMLTLVRGTNGTLTLTWTGTGTLEQASALTGSPSVWSDVTPAPTGNTYTLPAGSPALFFRVVSFTPPAALTSLTCTIATGNGPFATNGMFELTTAGGNYTLTPITPNVAPSSGTFTYSVSGSVGTVTLVDANDGPGSGVFTFTSPTSGTYVLHFILAGAASQTGTFVIP
jgi:hypothetical protein